MNPFVEAANRNKSILEHRAGGPWADLWTEAVIAKNPPRRVEFEHVIVFGTFAEALSMRDGKPAWGKLLKIEPLRPEDVLHPCRITYQLKASSKMRQRWEFRDSFKQILGRHRRIVTDAMRAPKGQFMAGLKAEDAAIIKAKLSLEPGEFWDRVRHGERFGQDGIHKFIQQLNERTHGYQLFPEAS